MGSEPSFMKPAMKNIEQSELKRKSTMEAYFFPPSRCCLFIVFDSGDRRDAGRKWWSSQEQPQWDARWRAAGDLQLPSQVTKSFHCSPVAHGMWTSAAENLIRCAESERIVKRFHVKTQPFLLTAAGRSAREHGSLHPYYVLSLCYVILSDSQAWRRGLQTTMAGYWAVVALVTSLLRLLYQSADLSQWSPKLHGCVRALAIVVLFAWTRDSAVGCLVHSSTVFVCVCRSAPMVSG